MNISGSSIYSDLTAVESSEIFLLLNHGPTAFVSTSDDERASIVTARWIMPVDSVSPKIAVMIDQTSFKQLPTPRLGEFALSVLGRAHAPDEHRPGPRDIGDRAAPGSSHTFRAHHIAALLIHGCTAWLECRLLPQATLQQRHGVFLADIVGAWVDNTRHYGPLARDCGEAALQDDAADYGYRMPKPAKAA